MDLAAAFRLAVTFEWRESVGHHPNRLMGNHGVLVTGESVAEALEMLYLLERACCTLVLAYSTG